LSNIPPEDAVDFLTRQLERYMAQKTKENPTSSWQEVIQDISRLRVPSLGVTPVIGPQGSNLTLPGSQSPTETRAIGTSVRHEDADDPECPSQPNWRLSSLEVFDIIAASDSVTPHDEIIAQDFSEQFFQHEAGDLMNRLDGNLAGTMLEGSVSPLTLTEVSIVANEIQVGNFSDLSSENTAENLSPLFVEESPESGNETNSSSPRLVHGTSLLTQRATQGSLSRKRKRLYSEAKSFEERRDKLQMLGSQWVLYWEEVSQKDVANADRMWEILVLIPVLGNGQFFTQLRKVLEASLETRHKDVGCDGWREMYARYTNAETLAHGSTMKLMCWKICIHREMIKRGKILEQEREKGLKPRNGNDRNMSEVIDYFVSYFTGMELEFVQKNRADQIVHRRRVQQAKKLGGEFDAWEKATNIPWIFLPASYTGTPLDESVLISRSR
jgi:hypothetical protein